MGQVLVTDCVLLHSVPAIARQVHKVIRVQIHTQCRANVPGVTPWQWQHLHHSGKHLQKIEQRPWDLWRQQLFVPLSAGFCSQGALVPLPDVL